MYILKHRPPGKETNEEHDTYQFTANSVPAPIANPFTAAMTGFFPSLLLSGLKAGAFPNRCLGSASSFIESFHSFKSARAENAFLPAPVMIATERLGSLSSHFQKASISQCADVFMQLRSFSRDMVASTARSAG